jgi:hypothetical protein
MSVLEDSKITISNENKETNNTEKINKDIEIDYNREKDIEIEISKK